MLENYGLDSKNTICIVLLTPPYSSFYWHINTLKRLKSTLNVSSANTFGTENTEYQEERFIFSGDCYITGNRQFLFWVLNYCSSLAIQRGGGPCMKFQVFNFKPGKRKASTGKCAPFSSSSGISLQFVQCLPLKSPYKIDNKLPLISPNLA